MDNKKSDHNEDFEHKSFEIDGRTVEYKIKIVEETKQDLINLSEKNQEFIAYCLVDVEILLKQLKTNINLSNYTAEDLDKLIYLWLNKKELFKFVDEEEFINAIGAGFGNYLNKTYNTVWTIIDDEYGTDYACVSESPNFKAFPFSSVWKAVEERREGSLQAIIDIIKKNLEDGSLS